MSERGTVVSEWMDGLPDQRIDFKGFAAVFHIIQRQVFLNNTHVHKTLKNEAKHLIHHTDLN